MTVDQKHSKKQEILEMSFEHFAREGYHGLSMRKLANHLNMTTGTLYHYFPNKEGLFAQLVLFQVTSDVESVRSLATPNQNVLQLLQVIFTYIENKKDYFKMMLQLILDFKRNDEVSQTGKTESVHKAVEDGLRDYRVAIQEILGVPDETVSKVVISLVIGNIIQSTLVGKSASLNDIGSLILTYEGAPT